MAAHFQPRISLSAFAYWCRDTLRLLWRATQRELQRSAAELHFGASLPCRIFQANSNIRKPSCEALDGDDAATCQKLLGALVKDAEKYQVGRTRVPWMQWHMAVLKRTRRLQRGRLRWPFMFSRLDDVDAKVYFKSGVLESLEERRALLTPGFRMLPASSYFGQKSKGRRWHEFMACKHRMPATSNDKFPGCKRQQSSFGPSWRNTDTPSNQIQCLQYNTTLQHLALRLARMVRGHQVKKQFRQMQLVARRVGCLSSSHPCLFSQAPCAPVTYACLCDRTGCTSDLCSSP